MRALITENSRLYRQLLDNLLGQQGIETDICSNLKAAKTFVDSEIYDLVFVNGYLEDGSGLELVKYCNQHATNRKAKILYLTSDSKQADLARVFDTAEIVVKKTLQQISDQITHFIEKQMDPLFSKGRILFVEDSKTITVMIMSQLTKTGYEVSHFVNAEQAWDAFVNETSFGSNLKAFDLIITDNSLEGDMTGQDLVAKVRALEDARGFVPIIAITGEDSDELRLSLYQSGVSDFLKKPVMGKELLIRVGNLITNKRLLDKVHDQRRELFTLATTDKLTGCHNRHSLMEFSHKFIAQAQRHEYPVSMMLIDLDHFKLINDNHGHAVGDIVLEAVGKLLLSSFREGDMVARFGGEEFIVLLNHCASDEAVLIAEQFREKMQKLKPNGLEVTASIGSTTLEMGDKGDFDSMFSIADACVYSAKEDGRNQVAFQNVGAHTELQFIRK